MENAPISANNPDKIQTMESNQENAPTNVEQNVQAAQQAVQAAPETTLEPTASIEAKPKRRGRPAGAKDKAPRRLRVVELDVQVPGSSSASVLVPVQPEVVPEAQLAQEPSPEPFPEPLPEPEPLTPRRLYRETSARLVHLKQMIKSDKRQAIAEAYTKKLISLP